MSDPDETKTESHATKTNGNKTKWKAIREMWSGLGLFLVIVLWIIVAYLNGGRNHDIEVQKIKACGRATDIAACIKQVDP